MEKLSLDNNDRPVPLCKGPICQFTRVANYFDDEALKVIDTWLQDESLSGAAIARHLNAKAPELDLKRGIVQRHRRGECACQK